MSSFNLYYLAAMASEAEKSIKIVVVGESGVGKTDYISRFCDNKYLPETQMTIGVDFKTKRVRLSDEKYKICAWDTAGAMKFRSITKAYFKGANAIIICYDITNSQTFNEVPCWITSIKSVDDTIPCMIVGTKCDLSDNQRQVTTEEGFNLARSHGYLFYEVSSLNSTDVYLSFMSLVEKVESTNKLKETIEKNDRKKVANIESDLIVLSAAGLKNVILCQDEEEFTFIFGKKNKLKMKKIFAEFLSPIVHQIHLSDPTVDSLDFDFISDPDLPNLDQLFEGKIIEYLLKISNGFSIEVSKEENEKLQLISIILNNKELFDKLNDLNPIEFDEENLKPYIQKVMILKKVSKNEFDLEKVFDKIANKFDSVDKEQIKDLPKSILYSIITNKNFVVKKAH